MQCDNNYLRNTSLNPIIQDNLAYSGSGDDACVDMQTLYNTSINPNLDMGSTYRYSIAPYTTDLDIPSSNNARRRRNHFERFNSLEKEKEAELEPVYIHRQIPIISPFFWDDRLILFFCFLFLVLSLMLLMNKSCEKDCVSF